MEEFIVIKDICMHYLSLQNVKDLMKHMYIVLWMEEIHFQQQEKDIFKRHCGEMRLITYLAPGSQSARNSVTS